MSDLLAGIRVLESAALFNGDTLGAHLADLGADVIKVESPDGGDYLRHMLGQVTPGRSPAHLQVNRGKRSVAIDLRSREGREVFWRLHDTAQVFVDGNAGDALERLGVGRTAQRDRRPDLVYCQYSGYGTAGPYAAIPTHGQMMDALAGAHPMAEGPDGFLHRAARSGAMGGPGTGGEGTAAGAIHAAFHVAAALVQRERTGQGAFIDVSGTDGVLAQAWIANTYALNDHRITDRRTMPAVEEGELTGAKYQYYATADGGVVLFCCIENRFWRRFCEAVARPDLAEHGAGAVGPSDFAADDDALRRELTAVLGARTVVEWTELAAAHRLPIGPAPRSVAEAAADPHVAARGQVHTVTFPEVGEFTYVGEAGRVEGQPYALRRPAPDLGQHTAEVLAELGVDTAASG